MYNYIYKQSKLRLATITIHETVDSKKIRKKFAKKFAKKLYYI